MPTEVLDNPALTDQSAAAIKEAMDAHAAQAQLQQQDSDPGEWDPITEAKNAIVAKEKAADAPKAKAAKEAAKTEAKIEVVETKAEVKPITADSTDDELTQQIESDAKRHKLDKPAKEALRQTAWEARESKRQAKALQTELDAVKAEVAKAREKQPDSDAAQALQKKLEEAQRRIDEQETELAGSRVEKTQLWKTEVATPLEALEKQFKKFASEYEVAPEELLELTQLRGKSQDAKFDDITAEWGKRKADRLADLLVQHEGIMEKQSEIRANSKQTYESVLAQEREARDLSAAQVASERAEALKDVWDKSVTAAVPSLKDAKDDDTVARIREAQSFIAQADDAWTSKQTVAERTRIIAQAAAFPVTVKHLNARIAELVAENATLKQHNGELKVATPGAAGNGAVARDTQKSDDDAPWEPFARAAR